MTRDSRQPYDTEPTYQQIKDAEAVAALARRCLWLAFVWNDHNFEAAQIEARKEAKRHGINSLEQAIEWLTSVGLVP
ncbi:MAG: hypothetical protein JO278_14560 [Dyella sp.]|nr:hypothetical protein [Dyella sp.]